MKYKDKEKLKEEAVQLYLEGKKYIEIAKILNISRNYVSVLIRDDIRVVEKSNIIKILKRKDRMRLELGSKLLQQIGINNNSNISQYVEVTINKKDEAIIVKKYQ